MWRESVRLTVPDTFWSFTYRNLADQAVFIQIGAARPAALLALEVQRCRGHPLLVGHRRVVVEVAPALTAVLLHHGDVQALTLLRTGTALLVALALAAAHHHRRQRLAVRIALQHRRQVQHLAPVQHVTVVAHTELHAKQAALASETLAADVQLALVGRLPLNAAGSQRQHELENISLHLHLSI